MFLNDNTYILLDKTPYEKEPTKIYYLRQNAIIVSFELSEYEKRMWRGVDKKTTVCKEKIFSIRERTRLFSKCGRFYKSLVA